MNIDVTGQAAPLAAVENQEPAADAAKSGDADRYAQLARREKMVTHQSRKNAKERMELEQLRAQVAAQNAPKAPAVPDVSWKDKLKEDPLSVLQEAGITYDDFVQRIVNQNPLDPFVKQMANQLKAQEERITKLDSSLTQQQQDSRNQAINQMKIEARQIIKSATDDFELVNQGGDEAIDAVVKLIETTFDEEGYVMDVNDALKEVEDYFLEHTLSLAKLKKVQAKLTPSQQAAQADALTVPSPKQGMATLTHSVQQQSKPLTQKERRERAILIAQGKMPT